MITPRVTRLVRTAHLRAFRQAVTALALDGSPLDARDRLIVLPTRAAAELLVRAIEGRTSPSGAAILPDFATATELVSVFAERLPPARPTLGAEAREVLLKVACRAVQDQGVEPPFQVRPGLIAQIVRFYDDLHRHQKDIDTFERLALGLLEPGAAADRGAQQLVQQTRFLAAVFREFERRCAGNGVDEHELRRTLLAERAVRPYRHVVVTVADRGLDPHGLTVADWDLLTRVPGLERLDVVVTDRRLAGPLHERIHNLLPAIEEVRFEATASAPDPVVAVPVQDNLVYMARDREDEVAIFARRLKQARREGRLTALDRAALVVGQPLPYVYLAQTVLESAAIPCQMFDALPLAAEPYAAAVDIVLTFVSSGFARVPGIQLLRSRHFRFVHADGGPVRPQDISRLERALTESGYIGDPDALALLVDAWSADDSSKPAAVVRAARVFQNIVRELAPLRAAAPVATLLSVLLQFLEAHRHLPASSIAVTARQLRARSAIHATIASLREAHAQFDTAPCQFDEVAALLRRWIEGQTFAPRNGSGGVHMVDAASAPFGEFDQLHLAGLVDGEWPDRAGRNIFYSAAILRELGWPAERERIEGTRAAFADLIRSPLMEIAASSFLLEHDALVSPSPLIDELESLPAQLRPVSTAVIFNHEALTDGRATPMAMPERLREWAVFRTSRSEMTARHFSGMTQPHHPVAYSLSGLERYQDCPFKFFACDVLALEGAAEEQDILSPRARGRFVHELMHHFFAAWDARGLGEITSANIDAARALFSELAEPMLAKLPAGDAALERARLFGSALSVGIVDVVLASEAERPERVRERWLEFRLTGDFSLGDRVRRLPLRGVADRIDLLEGNNLRVIDYKTGVAPDRARALQVAIYALCTQELLAAREEVPWRVQDAFYMAFSGKRMTSAIVEDGETTRLDGARARVWELVDGITSGEFPPRPHDPIICGYCSYTAVCRKDYVE